mmetsp:Transcript_7222/g.9389  ORF Transcript_7222/g.9389 Transcript_7222/m.9389 type:complete len:239 (-) Transcript_7222:1652-2368(-)
MHTKEFKSTCDSLLLHIEEPLSSVDCVESIGKHQRKHGHEFHYNIQGWTTSILERIPNSVSNNSSFMDIRSLALQFTVRTSLFNVLLGIVPSTTRVGHTDGQLNRGNKGTYEQSRHGCYSKEDSSRKRGENDHGTRWDHFPQTGLSRDGDTCIVVRTFSGVSIQKMGLLIKLTLDFHNHGHGSFTNTLHGHGSKSEWDHSTNNQESESKGFKHVDTVFEQFVAGSMTDASDKGTEQSK